MDSLSVFCKTERCDPMRKPPVPENEQERLAALRDLHIVDTPPEERFDQITRLAARVFMTPIALVSLVEADRQWFKSAQGLETSETPREVSFCAHAIMGDGPFVVRDAAADPRFSHNPLVRGEPGIRFYAGHPIRSKDGAKLGTLCVIDRQPRTLSEDELVILRDLAALVEHELQAWQRPHLDSRPTEVVPPQAAVDPVTRTWNRETIMSLLTRELARADQEGWPVGVVLADVYRLERVNEIYGRKAGDALLQEVAGRIHAVIRSYDRIGRLGEDEFLVVLPGCNLAQTTRVTEKLNRSLGKGPVSVSDVEVPLSVTFGLSATTAVSTPEPETLISAVTTALARAKDRQVVEEVHIERSIVVNCPPEECFAFLADHTRDPQWSATFVASQKTSPGPWGVGTKLQRSLRLLGRYVEFSGEITVFERNRQCCYRSEPEPIPHTMCRTLQPVAGGTRITLSLDIDPIRLTGMLSLSDSVTALMLERGMDISLKNLKLLLDR